MQVQWSSARFSATSATRILLDLLEDSNAERQRLIHGYLDAKRQLAAAFQSLLVESLDQDPAFGTFVDWLESGMGAMFPQIPSRYRVVKGFGATHRRLFAYLAQRAGAGVPIEELRVITRDAVHTERRLRELRDLGVGIRMTDAGGQQLCQLSLPIDIATAARTWILKQVAGDKELPNSERIVLEAAIG